MKRSGTIRLVLMGAGLTVSLSGCDSDSVAAGAYESVDQCAASGKYSRDTCQQAFADAGKEHLRSAPRFAKREDCEAEFGANACSALPAEPAATSQPGASVAAAFVPAMAGFMLANALSSGFGSQPLYRPCVDGANVSNDPRCRRSGSVFSGGSSVGSSSGRWFYGSDGTRVSSAPGEVSAERSAFSGSRASSPTMSRGGFGARAAHAAS
jgi:uncharacterized protein YgiB involved in biofilm formation